MILYQYIYIWREGGIDGWMDGRDDGWMGGTMDDGGIDEGGMMEGWEGY